MGSWDEYKKTYRTDTDIFDCARTRDFKQLVNILSQNPNIDLDEKNHRGYSALMLAVYNGEKDCCEALLRYGADVNSTDLTGNTVLMASAFKGDIETIKLLLEFGANATQQNQTKMNARDWALMFGRTEIVSHFDQILPNTIHSSWLKNIIRFAKLSFAVALTKIKS